MKVNTYLIRVFEVAQVSTYSYPDWQNLEGKDVNVRSWNECGKYQDDWGPKQLSMAANILSSSFVFFW